MSKRMIAALTGLFALIALVVALKIGQGSTALLWQWSNGGEWLLPLVSVSAILDSINPCAFSILIVTIAFLMSIGKLRTDVLKIGIVYILGLYLVYLTIGLGIMQALHLFNTPHFMAKLGALLMILLGVINLINEYFPAFPIKLRIPSSTHSAMARLMHTASLPTAFLLGVLVGLCEFPCTGGPYLMVLGLLHDQATYWKGFGYLLYYNVLFVLPLLLILAIASDQALLTRIEQWKRKETGAMRWWGAVAMIILGVLIFYL